MFVCSSSRPEPVEYGIEHAFAFGRDEIFCDGHGTNLARVVAMTDVRSRYRKIFVDGSNTERLVFFSDAVFAIALTLLVIDLKVPLDGSGSAWAVIVDEVPGFFAYALSFAIISINWMAHHRKFRVIKTHDGGLMAIDLALLFVVAFVPFPTSLISQYGEEPAAVVLYAFVVGLLSVLQYALWSWAWQHGLVEKQVDLELYRYNRRRQLATPAVFWLSIPIALLVSGEWAMYFWFALFPVHLVLGAVERSRAARSTAPGLAEN